MRTKFGQINETKVKYDKKVKRSASADLKGYTEKLANDTEKDDFKTYRV